MTLDAEDVLAAAARWIWVPEDAEDLVTEDYRLTHYPGWSSVQWSRTGRPVGELVEEVVGLARAAVSARVRWWVSSRTLPLDTASHLERRGFAHVETVEVLALPLPLDAASPGAAPAAVGGVEVVDVRDRETLAVAARLGAEVFAWEPPTEAQLDEELRAITADADTSAARGWTMRRYLALVDGAPAATAGATLDGDALRLWGGSTVPTLRGRGAYRALVARRLADAATTSARFAVVKAVDDTSSPILRRLGFERYGEERCWQLSLA